MAFTGKNIVPIVDGGAGLGSATKGWGGAFITNVTASSATQGGKLVLAANDGAVMARGHRLGVIEFKGAEDTSSTLTIGARIEALADATWSASENGASLKMYTTDANASESLVLTLDSDKLATFTGAVTVTGALTGTLATASQPNVTTLAGLTSFGSAGATTNIVAGDLTMFNPVTDGNPTISLGVDANEKLQIRAFYQSGTQELQFAQFSTFTAETDADRGAFRFTVDETNILHVDDDGIDLYTGKGIAINGTDILTDSRGTATLSNIDAIDATTKATLESALTDSTTDSLVIDTDRSADQGEAGAENITALHVDFDRTVPTSGTYAHNDIGIDLDVTSASLGTSSLYGMDIDVVGAASGTSTATGIDLTVGGADTNIGMQIQSRDAQLKLIAGADTDDYATFTVADTGDLTIETFGDGTRDSDLTLDADGQIKLEPAAGANILLDGTVTVDGGAVGGLVSLDLASATADNPTIKVLNTTDDDQASQLIFEKLRDDDAVGSGQNLGEIWFKGQDNAQNTQDYAYIVGEIDVSTGGQESGKLILGVANHDGGNGNGLVLTGGSEDTEIDVTVGLGANSVVTVPGSIAGDVTGDVTGDVSGSSGSCTGNAATATLASTVTVTDNSGSAARAVVFQDGSNALLDDTQSFTFKPSNGTLQITNTGSQGANVSLTNKADDATGPSVSLANQRVDSSTQAGEDDDVLGNIGFWGYDDQGTPAIQQYAKIYGDIHDATSGEESGRLTFQVANHDGGLGSGLILTGGSADNEIDVTIGLGTASETEVKGNISMGGSCNINASHNYTIDDVTIIGDSSGTATLYNIDALDATTVSTFTRVGSGRRYGSTIKILPSDFMINDDAASPLSFKDGSNSGVHVNDAANEAIAFITIPEGMKATHVDVFATHNRTLTVDEVNVNATYDFTSVVARGVGNCNTQLDITDTDATAYNYLAITVALSATSNRIWGGLVTIAPQ